MITKRVTLDDALDALRKAVAEKGEDYIYGSENKHCLYAEFVNGEPTPRCIVGYALAYLGVPLSYLAQPSIQRMSAHRLLRDLLTAGYAFEADASSALAGAQRVQDCSFGDNPPPSKVGWGAALAYAERFGPVIDGAQ